MGIRPGGSFEDKNRLGLSYQQLTFNPDLTVTEETKWMLYGAKPSCDEFPYDFVSVGRIPLKSGRVHLLTSFDVTRRMIEVRSLQDTAHYARL